MLTLESGELSAFPGVKDPQYWFNYAGLLPQRANMVVNEATIDSKGKWFARFMPSCRRMPPIG